MPGNDQWPMRLNAQCLKRDNMVPSRAESRPFQKHCHLIPFPAMYIQHISTLKYMTQCTKTTTYVHQLQSVCNIVSKLLQLCLIETIKTSKQT